LIDAVSRDNKTNKLIKAAFLYSANTPMLITMLTMPISPNQLSIGQQIKHPESKNSNHIIQLKNRSTLRKL
jgi:hypothetical protein